MNKKILIIEDDPSIAELISINLLDLELETTIARTGPEGLAKALEGHYALVVLDVMLPGLNGNEVLKGIRQKDIKVPVLVTTLKSELVDKIVSLELGADDYLTKPFSIQELVARVKALLRRSQTANSPAASEEPVEEIRVGSLIIDRYRRKVFNGERLIELTPRQFDLLLFLAQRPGRPFTRSNLLEHVWGYEHSGYDHTVDSHINRLRAAVEPDPSNPEYILTVWGVGYRFVENSELKAKRSA